MSDFEILASRYNQEHLLMLASAQCWKLLLSGIEEFGNRTVQPVLKKNIALYFLTEKVCVFFFLLSGKE